jgi:hypothetical protein
MNRVTVITPKVVSETRKLSAVKMPAKVVSFPIRIFMRKAA